MTTELLLKQVSKFNSLELAQSFSNRCIKSQMILMGDDSKYWVCTLGVARQLNKLGYECV